MVFPERKRPRLQPPMCQAEGPPPPPEKPPLTVKLLKHHLISPSTVEILTHSWRTKQEDGSFCKMWLHNQPPVTPSYIPKQFDILGEKLDEAFLLDVKKEVREEEKEELFLCDNLFGEDDWKIDVFQVPLPESLELKPLFDDVTAEQLSVFSPPPPPPPPAIRADETMGEQLENSQHSPLHAPNYNAPQDMDIDLEESMSRDLNEFRKKSRDGGNALVVMERASHVSYSPTQDVLLQQPEEFSLDPGKQSDSSEYHSADDEFAPAAPSPPAIPDYDSDFAPPAPSPPTFPTRGKDAPPPPNRSRRSSRRKSGGLLNAASSSGRDTPPPPPPPVCAPSETLVTSDGARSRKSSRDIPFFEDKPPPPPPPAVISARNVITDDPPTLDTTLTPDVNKTLTPDIVITTPGVLTRRQHNDPIVTTSTANKSADTTLTPSANSPRAVDTPLTPRQQIVLNAGLKILDEMDNLEVEPMDIDDDEEDATIQMVSESSHKFEAIPPPSPESKPNRSKQPSQNFPVPIAPEPIPSFPLKPVPHEPILPSPLELLPSEPYKPIPSNLVLPSPQTPIQIQPILPSPDDLVASEPYKPIPPQPLLPSPVKSTPKTSPVCSMSRDRIKISTPYTPTSRSPILPTPITPPKRNKEPSSRMVSTETIKSMDGEVLDVDEVDILMSKKEDRQTVISPSDEVILMMSEDEEEERGGGTKEAVAETVKEIDSPDEPEEEEDDEDEVEAEGKDGEGADLNKSRISLFREIISASGKVTKVLYFRKSKFRNTGSTQHQLDKMRMKMDYKDACKRTGLPRDLNKASHRPSDQVPSLTSRIEDSKMKHAPRRKVISAPPHPGEEESNSKKFGVPLTNITRQFRVHDESTAVKMRNFGIPLRQMRAPLRQISRGSLFHLPQPAQPRFDNSWGNNTGLLPPPNHQNPPTGNSRNNRNNLTRMECLLADFCTCWVQRPFHDVRCAQAHDNFVELIMNRRDLPYHIVKKSVLQYFNSPQNRSPDNHVANFMFFEDILANVARNGG